jgi:hypothetical protein
VIDPDSQAPAKSEAMVNAERERARRVKNANARRMYGPTHRRRRAQFARRLERGEEILCPSCGQVIGPDQNWDLGHDDVNPQIERPEHRACNRGAPHRLITSRDC